jgi:hypothetical protein
MPKIICLCSSLSCWRACSQTHRALIVPASARRDVSKGGVHVVFDEVVAADLKCLTEQPALVKGDEAGREACEGLVDVGTSVVADGQAPEAVEPGVGMLDYPSARTRFVAALDTFSRDARHDPARPAFVPPGSGIIGLVGVQLVRAASQSPAPAALQERDGIEGGYHHDAVVQVDGAIGSTRQIGSTP